MIECELCNGDGNFYGTYCDCPLGLKAFNKHARERVWTECFYDAKRFFKSKGNPLTLGRLKKKWHDNLMKKLEEFQKGG